MSGSAQPFPTSGREPSHALGSSIPIGSEATGLGTGQALLDQRPQVQDRLQVDPATRPRPVQAEARRGMAEEPRQVGVAPAP
jgi:hypothetical protein